MNYRRIFIPNSYVHIVMTSYNRIPIFTNHIEILRSAFRNTLRNYKFDIIAICVLPEHIHLILNPDEIKDYPKIISSVKHYFSKNVGQVFKVDNLKVGYKNKREKGIFQRRYFEHTIVSEEDLNNQIDYIHFNPVKHGYVKSVKDWKYSSFHKFVQNNLYDINWGNDVDIKDFLNLDYE